MFEELDVRVACTAPCCQGGGTQASPHRWLRPPPGPPPKTPALHNSSSRTQCGKRNEFVEWKSLSHSKSLMQLLRHTAPATARKSRLQRMAMSSWETFWRPRLWRQWITAAEVKEYLPHHGPISGMRSDCDLVMWIKTREAPVSFSVAGPMMLSS